MSKGIFSINGKHIINILYFLFCLTLYYVAIEILEALKPMAIVVLILGLMTFNKLSSEKIYIKPIVVLWMLSLFPFIISLFYTFDFNASLQFVLIYTATILIFIILSSSNLAIQKYTLDINYYFSVSIMIYTIISFALPSVFKVIFLPLLNEKAERAYTYFINLGELSGISGQTGTNAFLLSVGLAFLLFKKKSFINIILICLFLFSIIMSEKRGILLANGVAYFSVLLLFMKFNYKRIITLTIVLMTLVIALWIVLTNSIYVDLNEFSSGRIILYREAIHIFSENYLGGTGINTYSSITGINTHNVYFQLLSEVGLFGLLFFITAQLSTFIYILRLKNICNYMYKNGLNYYLTVLYFQIFFFVYSFVGNPLYDYNFFFIYLLLIAPLLNIKKWS